MHSKRQQLSIQEHKTMALKPIKPSKLERNKRKQEQRKQEQAK